MLIFKPIDAEKCQQITKDIGQLIDLISLDELDRLNRGIGKNKFRDYREENIKTISLIDDFCKATKAKIEYNSQLTHYCEGFDSIGIREKKRYFDTAFCNATENFYTDIFHELVHWSGAKKRLNRKPLEGLSYSEELAFEEVVAELGATYLGIQFNVSRTPLLAPASYIKRNLETLYNNKIYINKASNEALVAVEYLNTLTLNKM